MDISTEVPTLEDLEVVLSLKNPVFRTYLFTCALLTLKIFLTVLLIGRYRFGRGIVISPEDVPMARVIIGKSELKHDDPDLERVRRTHLNDIENIPLFMVISFCYLFTMPSPLTAAILFYLYVAFRVLHTFVYAIVVIPQPARFLAFSGGSIITLYLTIMVLVKIPPI